MTEKNGALRLFVAIDLPAELQSQLAARYPERCDLHWLPPERLHLTLAFIGAASVAGAEQIDTALSQIRFAPFQLEIDRLGSFHHRHVWLGVAPSEALQQLYEEVWRALAPQGLQPEHADFVPHITLARANGTSHLMLEQLQNQLLRTPLPLSVDQFCLKNSVLTPGGALHQVLALYDAST